MNTTEERLMGISNTDTHKIFHLSDENIKPAVRIARHETLAIPFSLGFVLQDEGIPMESFHAAFGTVQGLQRYMEVLFVYCQQVKSSVYWETLDDAEKITINEILAIETHYQTELALVSTEQVNK